MLEKKDLNNLLCFLPPTVKPPPLGWILLYVGLDELGEIGSVTEDIVLLIISALQLEGGSDDESMVVRSIPYDKHGGDGSTCSHTKNYRSSEGRN